MGRNRGKTSHHRLGETAKTPYLRRLGLSGLPPQNLVMKFFPEFFRKLEKAMAVSGVCSGVPEENSGKVPGKVLENSSRIAKRYKL